MNSNRQIFVLLFLFTIISVSCSKPNIDQGELNKLRPDMNENADFNVDPNANVAEDNMPELNSLINLPFEPVENIYKEGEIREMTESDGSKLIAVLKFNEADEKSLINQLESKGEAFETKVESEPWFPAELIAKSQTSGVGSIKGVKYNAELFLKGSYKKGIIIKINETNYFVLILQTD